jgi:3-oxoacyl-[acyl-carrier protein] reductase
MDSDLMAAERIALVTGATRGIGRAIVEQLLARGRKVVACARDGRALAELARPHPGRVVGIAIDLTQPSAAAWVVDEAERSVGPLSELVCAAGMVDYAPIGEVSEHKLRAQLELNFVAPFAMMQRAGVLMQARNNGSMVALASTLALRPAPSTAAYGASKAALISAVRSLALELAPSVRVNAVAPGVVDTDMVRVPRRALEPDERREQVVDEQLEQLRKLHPLGRLGNISDVADATLFLLEASWITGSVLTVDGGLTLA